VRQQVSLRVHFPSFPPHLHPPALFLSFVTASLCLIVFIMEEEEPMSESSSITECIRWCLSFKNRHFSGSSYSHGTRATDTWVYFTPNLRKSVVSELAKSASQTRKIDDEVASKQKIWVVSASSGGRVPKEIPIPDSISFLPMGKTRSLPFSSYCTPSSFCTIYSLSNLS
jgi:hypothetical protein